MCLWSEVLLLFLGGLEMYVVIIIVISSIDNLENIAKIPIVGR